MSHRHIRAIGVEAPGRFWQHGYDEGPPGPGQVRIETRYSGVSAGTEFTFLKGTNPYLAARFDAGLGAFVGGEPSARFPVPFLGYMEVGRVIESRSALLAEGAMVAGTWGHKSGHTADPAHDLLTTLATGVDPILGIYVGQMGPIAANGLLHAAAEAAGPAVRSLGDGVTGRCVMVWGAGVVGLFAALFARLHGASELAVVDPSPYRRAVAERLGLVAIDEEGAWEWAKGRWHHGAHGDRGADVVLQCRASGPSLHEALRALRPQGCVIDLAFYQGGAEAVRLGEEFHHNGLVLRCAQIGRVPRGTAPAWGRRRLAAETMALLAADGAAIRREMVTDVVAEADAPAFLSSLATERRDFVQIVIDYGSG